MSGEVGINFNVIGLGHAGSKIAAEFSKLGYQTLAINTNPMDLANIQGPVKLAIHTAGAGQDLSLAKQLFENKRTNVLDVVNRTFTNTDFTIIVAALGGGTGSGTIVPLAKSLKEIGYNNILAMVILPLENDGPSAARNSLKTLKEIALAVQDGTITSIMLGDNSKMFQSHPNTKLTEFWKIANQELVMPIHTFNRMTVLPTDYTALDPQDFYNILTTPGCMTFGYSQLKYYDIDSINQMTIDHFNTGLIASGFDLYTATVQSIIIIGSEQELDKLPKESETAIYELFARYSKGGRQFKGIYAQSDYPLSIYSIIGGMNLPNTKIKELKKLSKVEQRIHEEKQKFKADLSAFDDEED